MEIPFFWPALGFALGILLRPWLAAPEPALWAVFSLGIFFLWFSRGRRIFPVFLVLSFSCLGILFSKTDQARPENAVESFAVESHEKGKNWIWLEGRALVHPEIKQNGRKQNVSFVVSARRFSKRKGSRFESHPVSGKVQVFLMQPPLPLPEAGDQVRIAGNLEFPKPVLNSGGFDYKKYLAGQNIFCVLNGYGGKSLKILSR